MSVTDTTSEVPAGQASVVLMLSDISTEGYESYPQNSWEVFFRSVSGVSYLTADTVEDENTGRSRKMIYTAGRDSDQFVPLCGKPGCGHDSGECDAYITSDTFGFYDNKIFYAGDFADGMYICRMNMDGSGHCIINTVILEDDSLDKDSLESNYVYRYLFDNGYVYFAVDHDPGEAELFRIKLEEGAKREYYNIEGIDDLRTIFVPVNGVVYFDLPSREGVPKTYRCTVDAPPVVMNSAIMHDGTIKGYEFTEDRVSYYKCGAGITDGFYEADTITGEEKLIKEFSMTLPYGHAVYQG